MPYYEILFIFCQLATEDDSITIQYTIYENDNCQVDYQKDESSPEIYQINNIKFYIVTNFGTYSATWISDNTEGMIYGISSKDELIKILNSINEV